MSRVVGGQRTLLLRDALPIWWQVARPWFIGAAKPQALRYVAVCVSLAVVHTLVAVKVSYAQKHFSTALAEKNRAAWMSAVWEFVVIICLFAPIRSLESYAEKRMVAVWRTYLTATFITAYTSNKAYFHMQLARGTEGTQAGPEDQAVAAALGRAVSGLPQSPLAPPAHHSAAQAGGVRSSSSLSNSPRRSTEGTRALLQGYPGSPGQQLRLKTLRSSSSGSPQVQPHVTTAAAPGSSSLPLGSESTPLLLAATQKGPKDQQQQQQGGVGAKASPSGAVQEGAGGGLVAGLSDASAQVDNPDQRITADVQNFVQTSVGLVLLLVRKTLNCAAFAGVLWSISPKLVVFLLSYALLGTFGTAAVFGAPLTRLKQQLLRLEADLRFGLVRLRENAEAIAFYGGDVREASDLSSRLLVVLDVLLRRIAWLGGYELWLVVYRYATILIPSLVLAPEYFAGAIEFGTMTQASFAFNVLEEALRLILEKMEDLSSLAAETGRLAGLLAALRAADIDAGGDGTVIGFGAPPKASSSGGGGGGSSSDGHALGRLRGVPGQQGVRMDPHDIELAERGETAALLQGQPDSSTDPGSSSAAVLAVQPPAQQGVGNGRVSRVLRLMEGSEPGLSVLGLTACVPGRHHQPTVVCQDLSFKLSAGESLLVMGPSGCCKSSLLRIIAGLWTVGAGTVRAPARTFFLPQKPFMPLGSLRQQLVFPTECPKSLGLATAAAGGHRGTPRSHNHTPRAGKQHAHDDGHLHHQQRHQQQQQQHVSIGSSSSSTAVKPSSAVHRLGKHARGGSVGSERSSRQSSDPEAPSSATSVSAAAAAGFGLSSSSSSSHEAAGLAGPDSGTGLHACSSMDTASMDQQLQQLLVSVRLGHLLHRFPEGLDTELDWASVLSLGEQQRVALVRLLYHRPLLAFMDEATAALDPKSEAVVYDLIAQACRCYVSVGHRLQLLDWHSHVLVSAGAGHWVMYTTEEYRQRLAAGLEG